MKSAIASLAVGVALVALVGVGTMEAPAQQASDEPIAVGLIANLTGPDVASSLNMTRGVEMAVEEINAAGGVDGRPLELITEDSEYRPQEALNAATKLYEVDGVEAAIVFGGSSLMIPVAELAQQKGKVLINTSSSSPKLGEPARCSAYCRSMTLWARSLAPGSPPKGRKPPLSSFPTTRSAPV
jgi:branched-chain amino acid transport system substrate-binding protein